MISKIILPVLIKFVILLHSNSLATDQSLNAMIYLILHGRNVISTNCCYMIDENPWHSRLGLYLDGRILLSSLLTMLWTLMEMVWEWRPLLSFICKLQSAWEQISAMTSADVLALDMDFSVLLAPKHLDTKILFLD